MKFLNSFIGVLLQCTLIFVFLDRILAKVPVQQSSQDSQHFALLSKRTIQVAALGRTAYLGDLYDARIDNFVGTSLYKKSLPDDIVATNNISHSTVTDVTTELLSEKLEKLRISSSLSASFLGGLIYVSGSGEYLKQDKKSESSAKASLIYSKRTVRQNLRILSDSSKDLIDQWMLENSDTTHVVVGIEYGTDAILSLEESNTRDFGIKNVQKKLENAIKSIALSIYDDAKIDVNTSDMEKSTTFSVQINSDIMPRKMAYTINESIAFIKKIPQLIQENHDKKGKKMKFTLIPLVEVQKIFHLENNKSSLVKDISQEWVEQFIQIYDEVSEFKLLLRSTYSEIKKWDLMVPQNEFATLPQLKQDFSFFENDLKIKLGDLIIKFRNEEADENELNDFLEFYGSHENNPTKLHERLEVFKPLMRKIEVLNLFESSNALFLDRRTDLNNVLAKNYHNEIGVISLNLNTEISSPLTLQVLRILRLGTIYRVNHFIQDVPNLKDPDVKIYSKGILKKTSLVKKNEYVIIDSNRAHLTLFAAYSNEPIAVRYGVKKVNFKNTIAISNDIFYDINTENGTISSTNIDNIIDLNISIIWREVGSFTGFGNMKSSAAVNGSDIYFASPTAAIFKYDTVLKTVTKITSDRGQNHAVGYLTILNNTLYSYVGKLFSSFDGNSVKTIKTDDLKKESPGMFAFKDSLCFVGGESKDSPTHLSVHCYSTTTGTWTKDFSKNNECRTRNPGIANLQTGTLVIGGYCLHANKSVSKTHIIEFFNHDTKTWSSIPSSWTMYVGEIYAGHTFWY